MTSAEDRPHVVLDTNVLLAWWLFDDPACRPLAAAVEGERVRWIATVAMRAELEHVLDRGLPGRLPPAVDRPRISSLWSALVHPAEPPSWTAPTLRCRDGDDQKFVDLALAHRARWLVTRDRALLKLASRARQAGLQIAPPERFAGG